MATNALDEGKALDDGYVARRERLREQFRAAQGGVRLDKDTSNLFRDRTPAAGSRLDVRDFRHVLSVDPAAGTVDVEGMTPYSTLVDACLDQGVMPAVVPELRSITIGGAVSGVGIESSSFRYGLVHATMHEAEVLTGDGSIVTARPDNEHADLFHGLPNSYGTLGYALRIEAKTLPVKPYVRLAHERYTDTDSFFAALEAACDAGEADFIDATAFAPDAIYLTRGRFVDEAPYTSDYGFKNIYYRSIGARDEDYLTVRDYIWRWDTDWFWCSKNVYAQNPLVRRLLGRQRLSSVTYQKIMRWNARWGVTDRLNRIRGVHTESVIQDVDIPIEHAAEFLAFFDREIGIRPVWICPLREPNGERFTLYPVAPGRWYVNFGFWDVIRTDTPYPEGHFNRQVERKVAELGGVKSLYSNSYYPEDEFWTLFDRHAYQALKGRYDPNGQLKELYRKTVAGE